MQPFGEYARPEHVRGIQKIVGIISVSHSGQNAQRRQQLDRDGGPSPFTTIIVDINIALT